MLTLGEKHQTAPPLLPMLVEGQEFIDAQDELSVLEFMRKYGMPERINEEVFISMAKAPFIDTDKLSTGCDNGHEPLPNEDTPQMALDGNQPDRLWRPWSKVLSVMVARCSAKPMEHIELNETVRSRRSCCEVVRLLPMNMFQPYRPC